MHTVEVFKTNVDDTRQAKWLLAVLSQAYPGFRINFDLDDCDRILRIEGPGILPAEIITLLSVKGYQCQVLE